MSLEPWHISVVGDEEMSVRAPLLEITTQEACVTSLASKKNTVVTGDIYHVFIISPSHVANSNPPLSSCLLLGLSPIFNHLNRPQVNMCGAAAVLMADVSSVCSLSGCQRRNGVVLDTSLLSRLSHKRLMATFQVEAQRGEQDLYRCVTLSPRGAAVSNFGELIVRGKLDLGACD